MYTVASYAWEKIFEIQVNNGTLFYVGFCIRSYASKETKP